jgi:membrane protein YqaA with SNARE-associated domain
MGFLENLADWIRGFLSEEYFSYWIIILSAIALVESSVFPTQLLLMLPPDVPLMIFALAKPDSAILFAIVCTGASVVGGSLGFFLGRRGGRPILRKLISEEKIAAVDKLFARYGVAAVGIAGLTPLPYIAFTWSAGAFKLDFRAFFLISLLSRGTRFFAEGLLCKFWGEEFKAFFAKYFSWATVGVAVVAVGVTVLIRLVMNRRKKARRKAEPMA